MRLSIVIPTYQDGVRLERCLRSIEDQIGDRDVEILVVDNYGDEAIKDSVEVFPHARYLLETASGSYAARNAALRVATGEVIAFTDSDCIPASSWISKIHQVLGQSAADIVAGRVELFPQHAETPNAWEISDILFGFPIKQRIESGGGGVTANLIVRRNAIERAGLFDGASLSGEDMQWCSRARGHGLTIFYCAEVVVRHPARRTAWEHLTKARRAAGAIAEQIRAAHGTKGLLLHLVRLPAPPVRDILHALQNEEFCIVDKMRGAFARTIFQYYIKLQILLFLAFPWRKKERR